MLALGKAWGGAITSAQRTDLPFAWLEVEYVDDQTDTVDSTLWLETVPSPFSQPYIVVHPMTFTVTPGRNVWLHIKHGNSLLSGEFVLGVCMLCVDLVPHRVRMLCDAHCVMSCDVI